MTDVRPLLEKIDRALAEYDASNLPPLAGPDATAALDLAEQAGLDVTPWQRDVLVRMYDQPTVDESKWRFRWWFGRRR